MKRQRVIWTVIVAIVWVALGLSLKGHFQKKRAAALRTVHVTRGDLQVTILATGVVQPENRVEVKPPIPGRVEEILVTEGSLVTQGQILARLSSTERAALLDAARARGPKEMAHWEELYKPTPLVAPLNGVLIVRNVEPGQTVTAQDPVFVLSDHLIVKAHVDETDIGQIKLKQKAECILDSYPNVKIPALVGRIAYEAKTVSNVTLYQVDVLPEQVPPFMKSGMTANVTFIVGSKKDTLVLPAEAVRLDNGRTVVMIPNPSRPSRPSSREIHTGLSDGKRVEILSGLQEGETVLAAVIHKSLPSESTQVNPFAPFRGRRSQ
ncbi:MAG: HlyD family efflux transporter periplasmic adaptor subunit [Elusimicrobia bacterium]|nr:HlyD family efflux transporter periplasmic adaptor subunit [Elusimicrobiota bacterium]